MFRIFVLLLLTLCLGVAADEPPIMIKGQFHGKVRDQAFDQPFDMRLESGEKNEFRVELEEVDLNLGLAPKWHYTTGSTPDGMVINLYLKCRADARGDSPKLRLQRNACVLVEPGKKCSVELHDKDAENVFTVEFEAAPAGP